MERGGGLRAGENNEKKNFKKDKEIQISYHNKWQWVKFNYSNTTRLD